MALMKRQLHKQIIFRCNKPCQINNEACVLTTDLIFRIHSFHNVWYDSFRKGLFPKYENIIKSSIFYFIFQAILNKLYSSKKNIQTWSTNRNNIQLSIQTGNYSLISTSHVWLLNSKQTTSSSIPYFFILSTRYNIKSYYDLWYED